MTRRSASDCINAVLADRCGEREIRTPGSGLAEHPLSKRAHSTALPSLQYRLVYLKIDIEKRKNPVDIMMMPPGSGGIGGSHIIA
jgi:hypothetical protein